MAPRHDDEIALLGRIAERDAGALAELYDRFAPALLGVIRRIIRDDAESEDVLQEVLLQVWTRVRTYDPVLGTPVSWLVRIARNRAIDRYRAKRVRAHLEHAPASPIVEPASPSADPERAAANVIDRRFLGQALAVLPTEQRVLIEQAFFSGITHSELAEQFGLPLGTVKARIRQGLLAMRDRMSAAGWFVRSVGSARLE